MDYLFTPPGKLKPNCLILVGGTGDTAERFAPIAEEFAKKLPNHTICSLSLSQISPTNTVLIDQTKELINIVEEIYNKFESFDIFSTSMGAFPTINLLKESSLALKINSVVLFDPADYYLDLKIDNVEGELTWSGYQPYQPTQPTISDQLKKLKSKTTINVVHLTIRNHSANGYIDQDFSKRRINHSSGLPRLNTDMVKSFYTNTPEQNRGQYLEVNNIPHGFIRDGNIKENIENLVKITSSLLITL